MYACRLIVKKLTKADARAKQKFDARIEYVQVFEEGDLVLIKNRSSGALASKLVGPYRFVHYKDVDKYACILEDDEGK